MFKAASLLASLLCAVILRAQSPSDSTTANYEEVACDTVVEGHRVKLCLYDSTGKQSGWGNRNKKGQKHGYWQYLKPDGSFESGGSYQRGYRKGFWWANPHLYIVYGRRERIKRMEKSCRKCPAF